MADELTRLDAVIDYVLTNVQPDMGNDLDGHPITIFEGDPGLELRNEMVVLGNADIKSDWYGNGNLRRIEQITLDVFFFITVPGESATDARNRCITVANRFSRVMRTRPHVTLGGLAAWVGVNAVGWRPAPTDANAHARTVTFKTQLVARQIRF